MNIIRSSCGQRLCGERAAEVPKVSQVIKGALVECGPWFVSPGGVVNEGIWNVMKERQEENDKCYKRLECIKRPRNGKSKETGSIWTCRSMAVEGQEYFQ